MPRDRPFLKGKYKIPILSLSAILILMVALLMPVIPVEQYDNCSTAQINCQRITVDAPLYRILFCQLNCFGDSISGITLLSAKLSAGTASSAQARGTAGLSVVLANSATTATGITIVALVPTESDSSSITVFQCPLFNFCETVNNSSLSVKLNANQVSLFNTTASAFYISSSVALHQEYEYTISFSNGQSVSGDLVATNNSF